MTSEDVVAKMEAQIAQMTSTLEALDKAGGMTSMKVNFEDLRTSLMMGFDEIVIMETGIIEMANTAEEAGAKINQSLEPKWLVAAKEALDVYHKATMDTVKATTMTTNSLIKGTEDQIMNMINGVKTSWKSMFKGIMADLLRIQVRKAVVAGAGGILSLLGFEGGGYTGSGARAGGVDGRGGFPAILHPNETVVDHTKGGGIGGGVTTAEINFNVQAIDASSFNTYLVNNRDTIDSIINNSLLSNGTVRRTIQMTS